MNPKHFYKSEKSNLNSEQRQPNPKPKLNEQPQNIQMNSERRIAIPNFVSGDLQELDEKVKSMMETSQNIIHSGKDRQRTKICKMCGKEGQSMAIRDHIEANHLEGVSLPCNACGKEFRSRMNLRRHPCTHKWICSVTMVPQILFIFFQYTCRSRSQLRKHNCKCWALVPKKGWKCTYYS